MATKAPSPSAQDWPKLRASRDYRAFLQAYLEERSLSLSDLARATGFGRGFPGDVISGRRRLTFRSYPAFEKALKLPLPGRRLFQFLVAQDEPDLFPRMDRSRLPSLIDELRKSAWNRSFRKIQEREAPKSLLTLLQDRRTALVYAAAGEPETGATPEQIAARTQLSEKDLEPTLRRMTEANLLRREGKTFYPQSFHLFFQGTNPDSIVKAAFQQACLLASERVPLAMGSDSEFFFSSSFCIRRERLPELKAALRKTVLSFVDDSIDPEGDAVASFLASLHL